MNSILKFVGAVTSLLVASMGAALAVPNNQVPEPGSIALVGLAIAGAAYFSRRKK